MAQFHLKKNLLAKVGNYITGTTNDDVFHIYHNFFDSNPIINNPSSKTAECPSTGSCPQKERLQDQFQNDGKDTYYLASDIDTKNRTHIYFNWPHDGGHRAYIMDFDATLDKIILPKKVEKNNLLINRRGKTHSQDSGYTMEIVNDPKNKFHLTRSLFQTTQSAEDLGKLQSWVNTYDILAEIETNTNSIEAIMDTISPYTSKPGQGASEKKYYLKRPNNFNKKSADRKWRFHAAVRTGFHGVGSSGREVHGVHGQRKPLA